MSVVMIIVISALVQSFLTCIVIRKKNIEMRNYIENIILLWISFNYYILSVTKYYLGYKWENLLDSFWNAQIITFIHYSIPLILFSVGINLFLFFLKNELLCKILKLYRQYKGTGEIFLNILKVGQKDASCPFYAA